MPIWLIAGFADYLLHRRSKIETTSGTHESLIHLLMMTETGIPILMGLLLEINSSVILLSMLSLIMHELTSYWDLHYTVERRKVIPLEQMVHSFLEMLPFTAFSFITCLHWDQFLAVFKKPAKLSDFSLKLKEPPLPALYITGLLSAVALLVALPYLEELVRCFSKDHTILPHNKNKKVFLSTD
jgi:hypothetical protein